MNNDKTTKSDDNNSPHDRALRAAQELDREGAKVTADQVRTRARVGMSAALSAVKAWKLQNTSSQSESVDEEVPDQHLETFLLDLRKMWRLAREVGRTELDEARSVWHVRESELSDEIAELTDAVQTLEEEHQSALATFESEHQAVIDALEKQLGSMDHRATQANAQLEDSRSETAEARSRADRAEAALEVLTAERDRLLASVVITKAELEKEAEPGVPGDSGKA